jgi:hypothetical protein
MLSASHALAAQQSFHVHIAASDQDSRKRPPQCRSRDNNNARTQTLNSIALNTSSSSTPSCIQKTSCRTERTLFHHPSSRRRRCRIPTAPPTCLPGPASWRADSWRAGFPHIGRGKSRREYNQTRRFLPPNGPPLGFTPREADSVRGSVPRQRPDPNLTTAGDLRRIPRDIGRASTRGYRHNTLTPSHRSARSFSPCSATACWPLSWYRSLLVRTWTPRRAAATTGTRICPTLLWDI